MIHDVMMKQRLVKVHFHSVCLIPSLFSSTTATHATMTRQSLPFSFVYPFLAFCSRDFEERMNSHVKTASQGQASSLRTVLASSKFSDKCDPSPLDGYCASLTLALSQLQDAGLTRFIGPTKRCVAVAQIILLRLVLMLCTKDYLQGDSCHEDKRAGCAR